MKNLKQVFKFEFVTVWKESIQNLWRWFKIIWKDKDWDHYYLFKIMEFKLKNMERYHLTHSHIKDGDVVAFKIKICKLLIGRILEDDYCKVQYENHDKRWGKAEFNFSPVLDRPDLESLSINRDKVISKQEHKQSNKEFRLISKHENYMRKQDIRYLFYLMNKHIEGWWD